MVAGLVLVGAPILLSGMQNALARHGISSSLAAVYCHQTPKVRFSGMQKSCCEVGDLLLVHAHTPRDGPTIRNALLLQAKASSHQPYAVAGKETDQLALYRDWPRFMYHESPPLSGQERDVLPKCSHPGAQYILIDDRPPQDARSGLLAFSGTYPVGVCMPDAFLHDHNPFEREFVDFLRLRSGRAFLGRAEAQNDGWSALVWDLLNAGLTKAFTRKRSGRYRARRHAGSSPDELDGYSVVSGTERWSHPSVVADAVEPEVAHVLLGLSDESPPDERSREHPRSEDDNTGVSIVLLETSERRNQ